MRQFEVYRNTRDREAFPYVLVVQHELVAHLKSRVVVPLMRRKKFGTPVARLHPTFTIEGVEMVMVTHLLGAVPTGSMRIPVTDLSSRRTEIIGALDVLITGF
ncbi:MAG: CcdB family protein [Archangium sp.]|nr:CcdB family protein [Archangium sp.]